MFQRIKQSRLDDQEVADEIGRIYFSSVRRSPEAIYRQMPHIPKEQFLRVFRGMEQRQVYSQKKNKVKYPIVAKPGEIYQADITYHTSYNGYKYILVFIDIGSRYAWAFPLKNMTSGMVAKKFSEIPKPQVVQSDNGTHFMGEFSDYLRDHDIKQVFVKPFQSTAMSVVERFHRTLKGALIDVKDWPRKLGAFIQAYNHEYHSTLKATPADVLKGGESSLVASAEKKITKVKPYQVGDQVRIRINYPHSGTLENKPTTRQKFTTAVYVIEKVILRRIGSKVLPWYLVNGKLYTHNQLLLVR